MLKIDDEILSTGQTLVRMGINKGWWIENDKIYWDKEYKGHKPTYEEVLKEKSKIIKKEKYKKDRADNYPPLVDQLDSLYHDIKNGAIIDKEGSFFNSIKRVKDAHPKTIQKETE